MKVNLEKDRKGLSIRLEDGSRRAFRLYNIDESGQENKSLTFNKDVDAWTGEKDFLKKNNINLG